MRIFYLPIESYQERISELLSSWTIERWQKKAEVIVVQGDAPPGSVITLGRREDAWIRTRFALTQLANLVNLLSAYKATDKDVIYFESLNTPGIEALTLLNYLPKEQRPAVYAVVKNASAAHLYLAEFVTCLICSSAAHKASLVLKGFCSSQVHALGIPFSAASVRGMAPEIYAAKPLRVVYASRMHGDCDPEVFLDLVERVHATRPEIEFVWCSGAGKMPAEMYLQERIEHMEMKGSVRVVLKATKPQYYSLLKSARVHLCTARHEFLPYTLVEASALGTMSLAPAHATYIEALRGRAAQLYIPGSLDDAASKLIALVDSQQQDDGWLAHAQNATLDRILQLFKDHQKFRSYDGQPWWES